MSEKLKEKSVPFLSTIREVKSNAQEELDNECGQSASIVVIDEEQSLACSNYNQEDEMSGGEQNSKRDLIVDDIDTILPEFHYFFAIQPNMSESTLGKSTNPNSNESNNPRQNREDNQEKPAKKDVISHLTLTSRDEEFLMLLMKSYQIKSLFLEDLQHEFQVVEVKTTTEMSDDKNEMFFKLYIKYKNSSENEIKKFIKDFVDEKLTYKKNVDGTVEVEFNKTIDIDKDLEMLLIYLEVTERTHGGDFVLNSEKVLNERYLNVKFEDIKSKIRFLAQNLKETRSHKIYDYKILNITEPFIEASFEKDPRVIVLQNLMSQDDVFIQLFAENLQKKIGLKNRVDASNLFPNTFYVEYEKDYDLNELNMRLKRRTKKINKQTKFLKAYKTNTLIVLLPGQISNANEDIENSLKLHFCKDYKDFLQVRKLNKKFYLITYPTQALMSESISEEKKIFSGHEIIFEKFLSFNLLQELDSLNNEEESEEEEEEDGSEEEDNSEEIPNIPNSKDFKVDENFDPLIKAVFHLHRNNLEKFQEKFRKSYSSDLVPGKKYLITVYYDSVKTTEKKLRNLIKTYLELEFIRVDVNSIKLKDIRIRYDKDKVYIGNTENGVEVLGAEEDVNSIMAEIKNIKPSNIQSKQNNTPNKPSNIQSKQNDTPSKPSNIQSKPNNLKELKIDDKSEPLIKAVFHLNEVHFKTLQEKFENSYSTKVTMGPKYVLILSYDSTKNDEKNIKNLLIAYFDINFKSEIVDDNMDANDICQKFKINSNNLYIYDKNNEEVEIIGCQDDVEELMKKLKSIKDSQSHFVIDNQAIPSILALFKINESHLKKLQQKFITSYNATVKLYKQNSIKISYNAGEKSEAALKRLVQTYFELEFAVEEVEGVNVMDTCEKINYDKDNVFVRKVNDDTIKIIGIEDDVETLVKEIKKKLNSSSFYIENQNQKEFYIDETFSELVKVIFHNDDALKAIKQKFTTYFANIIPEKKYKIKVCYDSLKTSEKKLKTLFETYFDITYKMQVIKLFNIAEVTKKFQIDSKRIFINVVNPDEIEIYGLVDDVDMLVEQIRPPSVDNDKPSFTIDETFNPLVKVVFYIDNEHLKEFQDKFSSSYNAFLVPEKKFSIKVSYDEKKTSEAKLVALISTYLDLHFKFEVVESIKLDDINRKINYNHKNVHVIEKKFEGVEIFGLVTDVENIIEEINKNKPKISNAKEFTINEETNPLIKAISYVENSFLTTLQQKFLKDYSCYVSTSGSSKLKLTYDSLKQDEKHLKKLLNTYLDLELKQETIDLIDAEEILRKIEYNKKNVHVEVINGETVKISGLNDDVENLVEILEKEKEKVKKLDNQKEFTMGETDQALIKAVFHLNPSHLKDFKVKFETNYFARIMLGNRYNLKIFYNSVETNESKLKRLINAYLEMIFKIEKVSSSLQIQEGSYDEKNIYLNRLNNGECEIIGVSDEVDDLLNKFGDVFSLSQFRIFVLKNYKVNKEKSIPNLRIKFEKIDDNLYKILYENTSEEKVNELKNEAKSMINSLKKMNFEYDTSVIKNLKSKDNDILLFQFVQEKGLVCSFEYDDSGKIIAYVESLSIADQVRQLLDNFIATKLNQKQGQSSSLMSSSNSGSSISNSESKQHMNLKLFQQRIIMINGYDKVLKKKFPTLSLSYDKKASKLELSGDAKTVAETEQLIKTFINKIETQKVGFKKESVIALREIESTFLKKLNENKVYCVVEFDIEGCSLIFHATNQDIISRCKVICSEFLANSSSSS